MEGCDHLKRGELNGSFFCIKCGEELEPEPREPECEQMKAFKKVIYEFQGMYNETERKTPQELYDYLGETFPDRSKVSKSQLKDTLKKSKYKRYIKVIHWIHHLFTGVPKNDIVEYMGRLVEDFEYLFFWKRETTFDPQLILYVLLKSYDHDDYDRSEFQFKNYSFKKEEKLVEAIAG